MRTVTSSLLPLLLLAAIPLGACGSPPDESSPAASTDEEALSPLQSCMIRVCYPGEGPGGKTICGYEPMPDPTASVIAAGARTTYAIVPDGCVRLTGVYAWGSDDDSALGDGATTKQPGPVRILPFNYMTRSSNPIALAAGGTGACALLANGGVTCWGTIATSPHIVNPKPALVAGLPATVSQITHGTSHACALDTNGGVWCWGDNALGQLGDPSDATGRATPFAVPVSVTDDYGRPLPAKKVVAAGNTTCAEFLTGQIRCWGDNGAGGGLGIGTGAGHTAIPVAPNGFDNGAMDGSLVGGGHGTFCAYDPTLGEELCWGANDHGQAGVLPALGVQVPPTVYAPFHADAVTPLGPQVGQPPTFGAIGGDHACWASSNVDAQCFGAGALGQIGDAQNVDSLKGNVISPDASPVSSFASGEQHSCAIVGGTVYCWGANDQGQLGAGSIASSNVGVEVGF